MNQFFAQLGEVAPGGDFVPDEAQARVLNSDARRVLLCCSRQFGKSTTAALLAARTALAKPKSVVVCVSPTLRQSGELIRKVREFLGVKSAGLNVELPNGSRVLAAPARQGTVRGYSAVSLLIVDEAAQVDEDVYRAVRPMLAVGGGRLMLLSTPFGQRGFFWREWSAGGEGWLRIEVKATECKRIPAEFLEEERVAMGEEWFGQEYLCSFVGMENAVFNAEWIAAAEQRGLSQRRLFA